MQIMTTGTLVKKLRINKDKYFRLEESGYFPQARRTPTGKRFFLPGDVTKLKKLLDRRERGRR